MSGIGHNGLAKDQLRSIVERIERLEEEKDALSEGIKEVYAEAKGNGFDTKILRQVVRLRKQDKAERAEQAALLNLYMEALGMLADTPLGKSAIERVVNDPKVRSAFKKLGTPVELTEAEKADGDTAAFEQRNGTRISINPGRSSET